jgi:lipopolysaccharide biosynthesis glycosyltransferase
MPLAVTLFSLLENLRTGQVVDLYIIDGGISDRNKRKILKSLKPHAYNLTWLSIPDDWIKDIPELPGLERVKIVSYYRLFIPILLPLNVKKAIYLDSDVVICCNIAELWNLELSESYVLAVQDTGNPFVSSDWGLRKYKELGLEPDHKYFNAGVLVINLDKWRTEHISEKVIEYLITNQEYVNALDQDGLNAILANRWIEIDPRWNQQPQIFTYASWNESQFSEEMYNNLVAAPYIVHYATGGKPWNTKVPHPFKDLFFKYVDMTDWKGYRFDLKRRLWRRLQCQVNILRQSWRL